MGLLERKRGIRQHRLNLRLLLGREGSLGGDEAHGFQEGERLEGGDAFVGQRHLADLEVGELREAGEGYQIPIGEGLSVGEREAAQGGEAGVRPTSS